MKDEDYVEHLLVANSHATLLLFSSKGKVYWLRTFEIPEASRAARGRPLVNLLPLDEGERITAMLQIDLEALQQSAGADEDLEMCIRDSLKDMLEVFVRHRREVVTRRTVYELRKARERGHILEGQAVALSNIDPVIELIKASPTPAEAKERLIATAWESSAVEAMVERAGADSCRPEGLDPQYGLRDGKYYLCLLYTSSTSR